MVLLSTSPGGRGGKSVLELALAQIPRFGGRGASQRFDAVV